MRFGWVIEGLRTGVVTTNYPARPDSSVDQLRMRPVLLAERCQAAVGCAACVQVCLPNALTLERPASTPPGPSGRLTFTLDLGRCIGCGLCAQNCPAEAITMISDEELAVRTPGALRQTVTLDAGTSAPGGKEER